MSSPANPLAAFRSYSYYHVLVMCDSTQTADIIGTSNDLDIWDHATQQTCVPGTEALGAYAPKCVSSEQSSGRYIVLINGSTDAAYVIESAKWSTVTAANAVSGDRGRSIAIEGSIAVSEPKGIAFLDQVVQCSLTLGVDSSQIVYVLKTFFVGHLDENRSTDGTDAYPIISDIAPLNLIVYDVQGTFTERGGTYTMEFVSVGHGAARLPQYSKAVNAMSITAGNTLGDTLDKLAQNINEGYERYFNCVRDQMIAASGEDSPSIIESLRKVRYVIECPDYRDAKYTVTDQPAQSKNTASCDAPAQITFQAPTSIESAITQIMQMSAQVKDDMNTGDSSSGQKYEFVIHTALSSISSGGDGSNSCAGNQLFDYTVLYRVQRQLVPKSVNTESLFNRLQSEEFSKKDHEVNKIQRNIIEFEYMYTGKNIDILEFDMKMNYGLAYLQTATIANSFKSQIDRAPNRQVHASSQDMKTVPVRLGGPVQIPVFFGQPIRSNTLINSQNGAASAEAAFSMTKHSSLEVAEVTMKITGNAQLLTATSKTTSAKFVTEGSEEQQNSTNMVADDDYFKYWSSVPAFAKVKIMMPRNNDDFALFTGTDSSDGNQDYAREFWYDGYYYLCSIEHEFNGGEFTQNLTLIALPKKSAFDSTKSKNADVNLNTSIGSCFDNKVGCGPAAAPATVGGGRGTVNPPFERPGTDGTPTNQADAATANTKDVELDSIAGWTKADPRVKQAIVNAAQQYGLKPVLLAKMAAKESSFKPNAKAGTSSASGLFQFIEETWLNTVRVDPAIGVNSSAPRNTQLQARFDIETNAKAGASFTASNIRAIGSDAIGDVYLAHFAGVGVAKPVIEADLSGRGNVPLVNVIGTERFNKMRNANRTIITRPDYTVGELRAWAALAMSSQVAKTRSVALRPGPLPTTTVSSTNTTRTAGDNLGAAQDCKTQAEKTDTKPCGPGPARKGQ